MQVRPASGEAVEFRPVGGSNPLILLPARVNGTRAYDFLLDSGATRSIISPGLASELGIEAKLDEPALGAGGSLRIPSASVRSIEVGSARQEEANVCISDGLGSIGAALRTKIDGVIGFDFMSSFRLTIDYQKSVLHFGLSSEDGNMDDRSDGHVDFTLTPTEPLILLQGVVHNQGPFQFILDTAASRTVVTPALIEQLKIPIDQGISGTAMGGKVNTQCATANSFVLGGVTVHDLPVVVGTFLDAISTAVGAKLDGIIGNNLLRRYRATIDCPARKLILAQPDCTDVPA